MRREQLPVVAVVALGIAVALALVVLVVRVRRGAEPVAAAAAGIPPSAPGGDETSPRSPPTAAAPASQPSPPADDEPTSDEPPSDERGAHRRPVGGLRGILGREGNLGPPAGAARSAMATTMQAANAAYDRQDFEGAAASALEVLAAEPDNVRMLRVVVSASCALDDEAKARQYYAKLPAKDQASMARRCGRFGITF